MTKTLRDLIETEDYADCVIAPLRNYPGLIEQTLFGEALARDLPEDFAHDFDTRHEPQVIVIPAAARQHLALLILDGETAGLIWHDQENNHSPLLYFLSPGTVSSLRAASGIDAPMPEVEALLLAPDVLDIPLEAGGEQRFDLGTLGSEMMPSLTLYGIHTWLAAAGGLLEITHIPAMKHAVAALDRRLADIDRFKALLLQSSAGQETQDSEQDTRLEEEVFAPLATLRDAMIDQRDALNRRLGSINR